MLSDGFLATWTMRELMDGGFWPIEIDRSRVIRIADDFGGFPASGRPFRQSDTIVFQYHILRWTRNETEHRGLTVLKLVACLGTLTGPKELRFCIK